MTPDFPRLLQRPGQGRPNWFSASGSELIYLGWGERHYGKQPIPVARHTGWAYLVIPSGQPKLVLAERSLTLQPGSIFVMHPDCASGWSDTASGRSSVLSWIWQTPPPKTLDVPAGSMILTRASPAALERLQQIHIKCRVEVSTPDEFTPAALAALHGSLDVEFQRAFSLKAKRPDSQLQLELAVQWMRHNLHSEKPIELLCSYLELSPSSLHRLFVNATQESPMDHFQRFRMENALKLLQAGDLSVKEIAYAHGYKHPNDFTRAFTRYFKATPRAVKKLMKSPATQDLATPGTDTSGDAARGSRKVKRPSPGR